MTDGATNQAEETTVAPGPLGDVRVLELGSLFAGPWAGRVLSDFGAQVIKIEPPGVGDPSRLWRPTKDGVSLVFVRINRGKRSVAIDLRGEEGRDLIRRLVRNVDVVVVNFRPDTLERWGLDYGTLSNINPRLVYVSISGFGLTGPKRDRPGFGSTADAISGFAHIVGFPDGPPTLAHFGLADLLSGTMGAFGATIALRRREQTGKGDLIDVALYEPLMTLVGDIVLNYSVTGEIANRVGNSAAVTAPTGTFLSHDNKWIVISGSSQSVVERLFHAMDRDDLIQNPRFATNAERLENRGELYQILQDWIGAHNRDELLAIFERANVVAGPVNTAEDIASDEHFLQRTLMTGKSEMVGDLLVPRQLFRMQSMPASEYVDPPVLGADTTEILSTLADVSPSQITSLRSSGVVA